MARKRKPKRRLVTFKKHFNEHMTTDYTRAPGVLTLNLRNAKPIIVGYEFLVEGIASDGLPMIISREEALGMVEILSEHEIYQVRAPEAREIYRQRGYVGSDIARQTEGEGQDIAIPFIALSSIKMIKRLSE